MDEVFVAVDQGADFGAQMRNIAGVDPGIVVDVLPEIGASRHSDGVSSG
jgi:hypothetical protein